MKLFDAHCHLPEGNIELMLERAAAANVTGLALCGTSPDDWDEVCQYSEKFPEIFPMIGIHPWFVSGAWQAEFQRLKAYCIGTHKLPQGLEKDAPTLSVGIGECGLDFSDQFKNRVEQEECFSAHLKPAEELNRPVAVHCVRAWGRLLEILREHPAPKKILHAFSGAVELIPEFTELNCWFSFCGNATNPNAKRVHAAAAAVPQERLLIETDAPDFPPTGCSAPNEPANLIYVARAVAKLRTASVEQIADITRLNAECLFQF